MNPITFIVGLFFKAKNSAVGRAIGAVAIALATAAFIFNRGKSSERKEQRIKDLKRSNEIRKRVAKADEEHKHEMETLPSDPDARRSRLSAILRKYRQVDDD